jgi:hypothetical protein
VLLRHGRPGETTPLQQQLEFDLPCNGSGVASSNVNSLKPNKRRAPPAWAEHHMAAK